MAAIAAIASQGPASAAGSPAIAVAEPDGFATLTRERRVLVDVYFGGVRQGEALVLADPETVTILDPAALLELLPPVTERSAVEAALAAQPLPANSELACAAGSDRSRCGRLAPETIGVIFDRDRFRLDVFFNPSLLAVQDNVEDRYLPLPSGGPSVINAIGAVLSGRSGPGKDYYNLQDQLVLGWGDRRLRADLSYATELGLGAERLAVEWDRPELRLSAGALWAPGNDIRGRQKLLGVGIASQVDTRLDREEILGSPVVVYLDQRARIDVVRDGRVLHSAFYDAGNQQVDTSSLPEGSYEIVLRIEEAGRPPRDERRFYTKSRRVPSAGRTDFFAFAGMLVDGLNSGSLDPSDHPYVSGGIVRRLARNWAIEGSVEATDAAATAELGAILLTPLAQVRAVAAADLEGAYGGIVQVASSGTSRLTFNLDMRHFEAGADGTTLRAPLAPRGALGPVGSGFREASYSQAGGIVSYSLADFRFLGAFSYRDEDGQAARYSVGPSLEWDVLRKGRLTLTVRGEVAVTERGNSGFAGISLRMFGGRASLTGLAGARASSIADDEYGEGPVAAVTGAWTAPAAGGEIALGAGYDHQPRQDAVVLSGELRHPLGSLSGDFVRSAADAATTSQYSLGFQTTLAAGAGAVQVAGKSTSESLIVARVSGAREQDRFEVLVNEQVMGTIAGSGPLALALPAYRAYTVRVRPIGEDLLAYDSSPRTVGLYPGAAARLEWSAAPVTIKFGRLVAPDGTPVAGASITGKGVWSETDADGYFQIEVAEGAALTVTTGDGASFAMDLPRGEVVAGIARLGAVVCCGEPAIRLGTLAGSD